MQHRPWWPPAGAPPGQGASVSQHHNFGMHNDPSAGMAALTLNPQGASPPPVHLPLRQPVPISPLGLSWSSTDVHVDVPSVVPTPPGGVLGSIFNTSSSQPANPAHPTLLQPSPSTRAAVPIPYQDHHTTAQPAGPPVAMHLVPTASSAVGASSTSVSVPTDAESFQPLPDQQYLQEPTCCTAIYLTDASMELLSCLMPPVHPHTSSHSVTLQPSASVDAVMCMPLGAQVEVQLTGITADHLVQAVSVTCPEWCPPCSCPVPYLLLSHAGPEPDHAHAETVVAEGVTGVSSSYHPLSEPLPLVGTLGMLLQPPAALQQTARSQAQLPLGPFFSTDCIASAITDMMLPLLLGQDTTGQQLEQPPAPPPQHLHQQQQYGSQQQGIWMDEAQYGSSTAAADADLPYSTSQRFLEGAAGAGQQLPTVPTSQPPHQPPAELVPGLTCRAVTPAGDALVHVAASTPGLVSPQQFALTPMGTEKSEATSTTFHSLGDTSDTDETELDEFELWMRQDERLVNSVLPPNSQDRSDQADADAQAATTSAGLLVPVDVALSAAASRPAGAREAHAAAFPSLTASPARAGRAAGRAAGRGSTAAAAGAGGAGDGAAGGGRHRAPGALMVVKTSDVGVGDLVEVCPLIHLHHTDEDDHGTHNAPELVQGVVQEVVIDDPIQPQGVLVRLDNDNTMGYTARVILRGYQQTQEAWPELATPPQGGSTATPAASSVTVTTRGQKPTSKAVGGGGSQGGGGLGGSLDGRLGSVGSGSDVGPGGGSIGGASSSSGTAKPKSVSQPQPAGGSIKVLHRSTAPPTVPRPKETAKKPPGAGSKSLKPDPAVAVSNATAPNAAPVEEEWVMEMWREFQKRFGDAICEAVLEDCDGRLMEAVQVLEDQEGLPDRLGDIVVRSIARVEEEAVAAAAAIQTEADEAAAAAQQSRGGRGGKGGGGWAQRSSRPGAPSVTYVRATDRRSGPAPPDSAFPATLGSPAPAMGGPAGSWSEGSSKIQVKLLRNVSSMASQAAAAGLNVKDLEALAQLFPGFTPPQLISILQLANGDVTAAVDELLTLGLSTGPEGATDKAAYEYVSGMLGIDATPDPFPPPATPQTATSAAAGLGSLPGTPAAGLPESVWSDGVRGVDVVEAGEGWQSKIDQLMFSFEGLERDVAAFSLRSCSGDIGAATRMIHDSWTATADAAAAADASSLALAERLKQEEVQRRGRAAAQAKQAGSKAAGATTSGKASGQGWQVVSAASRGSGSGRPARSPADAWKAKHKVSADKSRHIAHIYFGARNVFFQQAAAAYAAGNGKAAAEYAAKGKEYGELAKQYRTASNDEAYKASNWGVRNQFTMDLHGMHVEEALSMLSQQVEALSRLVTPDGVMLKVITGKGNHSINNVAAIKPAVLDWLRSSRLRHSMEPGNEGVVLVHVKAGGA